MALTGYSVPTEDFMPGYHRMAAADPIFNVTILVVVTFGGVLPMDLRKSGSVIELAVKTVREVILPDVYVNYHMVSKSDFSDCYHDENHAAYLMTKFAFRDAKVDGYPPVGLIVGPSCTKALESSGRIVADSKVPMITSQGYSLTLDDKNIFRTLTRTGVTVKTLARFCFEFLDKYSYTNVAVIYDDLFSHSSVVGSMFYRAFYYRQDVVMSAMDLPFRGVTDFSSFLYQAANNSRGKYKPDKHVDYSIIFFGNCDGVSIIIVTVIFLFAQGPVVRQMMVQAYKLGMTNGDYVYITCEWYKEKYWGSYSWQAGDDRDEVAKHAFRSLFILKEGTKFNLGKNDMDTAHQELIRQAKSDSWNRFGYGYEDDESISPAVIELYDGIILWATALNETLASQEDPLDGLRVTHRMWDRQMDGINGSIKIDANGDRDCSYVVLDMLPDTGQYKAVYSYVGHGEPLVQLRPIDWGPNRASAPPNEPECGYKGDRLICFLRNGDSTIIYAAVGAVSATVFLILVVGFCVHRKVKMEQSLQNTWWRVNMDEVKYRGRAASSIRSMSRSFLTSDDNTDIIKLSVARYRERQVIIKSLDCKIELSREFLVYLSKLRGINHENVNPVIGICPEPNHEAVLMEFCAKGGLSDVLEKDDMDLDWGFKSSLITDLVAGLDYIHSSFLQSHGNLHSSNCVVDSRFTLKITDYAFPEMRGNSLQAVDAVSADINYRALLWRAPEFLRTAMPPAGSQKGDVYSMAVILSEIVSRRDPYTSLNSTMDTPYVEIINRVRHLENPPFRPQILPDECPLLVGNVIQLCWAEYPKDRLTVREAQRLFKENGVEKGSVMDKIIKRMEQYAVNLESTVNDRTKAFLEEKRKVEELLYEILPRAVADALKSGKQISPEAFDMVTIYYSDIVGFTTISARSTAFQVVDLLNDLYTLFDGITMQFDAYKVETIGDAYVIASGVPIRNGNRHAKEIAGLSICFRDGVAGFKMRHLPDTPMQLRIGLHSGYCAAGVVGVKMPRYCLFGESVQFANKMESSGEAEKIQISEATKLLLDEFNEFDTEYRHQYDTGKGDSIATYWLIGRRFPHVPTKDIEYLLAL